jgi:hypothetical protein
VRPEMPAALPKQINSGLPGKKGKLSDSLADAARRTPAIIYSLLRLREMDQDGIVAFFPICSITRQLG